MKRREVVISPEARSDLIAIYLRIAGAASDKVALDYIARIEARCLKLDLAAERGTARDDLVPGLRTLGVERRATIAFTVSRNSVTVLRVFGKGFDWEQEFS